MDIRASRLVPVSFVWPVASWAFVASGEGQVPEVASGYDGAFGVTGFGAVAIRAEVVCCAVVALLFDTTDLDVCGT